MKFWFGVVLLIACGTLHLRAQAPDGMMSEAEVESLREAAYDPADRILAYEKILDTRAKRLNELFAKRRHTGREQDAHDILEQFAAITDEFLDNIGDYRKRHRDVRKVLPKLAQQIDRWSVAVQAPPADENYNVVRKLASDNLKDLHDDTLALGPELETYFKEHPDALKLENSRMDPRRAHAPQ